MTTSLRVTAYDLPSTVSVAQAAQDLGVSEDSVYKLVHSKALPASRVIRRLVIRRDDLDEFLLKNRV